MRRPTLCLALLLGLLAFAVYASEAPQKDRAFFADHRDLKGLSKNDVVTLDDEPQIETGKEGETDCPKCEKEKEDTSKVEIAYTDHKCVLRHKLQKKARSHI